MSKFDALKKTAMPPNKTTRRQLPDTRINSPAVSQANRSKVDRTGGKGKPFGKVGQGFISQLN